MRTFSLLVWIQEVSIFKALSLGQIHVTELRKNRWTYHQSTQTCPELQNRTLVMPFKMCVQRTLLQLQQSFLRIQVSYWVVPRVGCTQALCYCPEQSGKQIKSWSYYYYFFLLWGNLLWFWGVKKYKLLFLQANEVLKHCWTFSC